MGKRVSGLFTAVGAGVVVGAVVGLVGELIADRRHGDRRRCARQSRGRGGLGEAIVQPLAEDGGRLG